MQNRLINKLEKIVAPAILALANVQVANADNVDLFRSDLDYEQVPAWFPVATIALYAAPIVYLAYKIHKDKKRTEKTIE